MTRYAVFIDIDTDTVTEEEVKDAVCGALYGLTRSGGAFDVSIYEVPAAAEWREAIDEKPRDTRSVRTGMKL